MTNPMIPRIRMSMTYATMREAVSANESPGAPGTSTAVAAGAGAQLTMGPDAPGAPGGRGAAGGGPAGGGPAGGTSHGGVPIGPSGVCSSISASPHGCRGHPSGASGRSEPGSAPALGWHVVATLIG